MKSQPPEWLGSLAVWVFVLAVVSGLALVGAGVWAIRTPDGLRNIGWGLFAVAVGVALFASVRALVTVAQNSAEEPDDGGVADGHTELLKRQLMVLQQIHDSVAISDAAKAIAYRSKDREALRAAIREDLDQQDWEAAYFLIDEMERRFGYRQEAEGLRAEIDQARQQAADHRVDDALAEFERLIQQHDWNRARNEYERLSKLYPTSPKIRVMPERIDQARLEYKNRIIRAFQAAAERNETERAMELLRELDHYLTPKEAEAFSESAKNVIKDRLRNLQLSFTLAWNEKDWRSAIDVANQIVEEFPTSKMAGDVRQRLQQLRELAETQPA